MIIVNEVAYFQVNSTSSRVNYVPARALAHLLSLINATARDTFTVLVSFLVPANLVVLPNERPIWLILR